VLQMRSILFKLFSSETFHPPAPLAIQPTGLWDWEVDFLQML